MLSSFFSPCSTCLSNTSSHVIDNDFYEQRDRNNDFQPLESILGRADEADKR
jgi:hypothetical protein